MNGSGVLEPLEALAPLQPGNGEPQERRPAQPWSARVIETVSAYLPVLLMGLLALGSWWLVKSTPPAVGPRPAAPPRHEADYTMHEFSVQRFTPEGRLRAQIEGETLRHFPDTETMEVERPRVVGYSPDGSVTLATAQRAISNSDASEVQLIGDARVTRSATAADEGLSFRGEFLHAFLKTEQLRSHLPVTVNRGNTVIRADTFSYDHLQRTVSMQGHVRASFAAAPLPKPKVPA